MFIIILVSINTFSIAAKLISEIIVQYDYLTIMASFHKTTIQFRGYFYFYFGNYVWFLTPHQFPGDQTWIVTTMTTTSTLARNARSTTAVAVSPGTKKAIKRARKAIIDMAARDVIKLKLAGEEYCDYPKIIKQNKEVADISYEQLKGAAPMNILAPPNDIRLESVLPTMSPITNEFSNTDERSPPTSMFAGATTAAGTMMVMPATTIVESPTTPTTTVGEMTTERKNGGRPKGSTAKAKSQMEDELKRILTEATVGILVKRSEQPDGKLPWCGAFNVALRLIEKNHTLEANALDEHKELIKKCVDRKNPSRLGDLQISPMSDVEGLIAEYIMLD